MRYCFPAPSVLDVHMAFIRIAACRAIHKDTVDRTGHQKEEDTARRGQDGWHQALDRDGKCLN